MLHQSYPEEFMKTAEQPTGHTVPHTIIWTWDKKVTHSTLKINKY